MNALDRTYCRIVTAMERTIALQGRIDAIYPEVEKKILDPPT